MNSYKQCQLGLPQDKATMNYTSITTGLRDWSAAVSSAAPANIGAKPQPYQHAAAYGLRPNKEHHTARGRPARSQSDHMHRL